MKCKFSFVKGRTAKQQNCVVAKGKQSPHEAAKRMVK
jgi:hypothetical protein